MSFPNLRPEPMAVHFQPHPAAMGLGQGQSAFAAPLSVPHASNTTLLNLPGGTSIPAEDDPAALGRQGILGGGLAAPHMPGQPLTRVETMTGVESASFHGANGEAGNGGNGALSQTLRGQTLEGTATSAAAKPIRRRMRMITSCLECRRRKLKCDKSQRCLNCEKFQRNCLYISKNLDEAGQARLTHHKEAVGAAERRLELEFAKGTAARSTGHYPHLHESDVDDDCDDEGEPQLTPMVALEITYEDAADEDNPDDFHDLGIKVGRMRITERIGGLNRPRISEEIHAGIGDSPPSSFSPCNIPSLANGKSNMADHGLPEFMKPGPSFIPPTSGLFFGKVSGVSNPPPLVHFLPSKELGDRLMQRYFEAVHPVARCVHRPSFEALYHRFWEKVATGIEPRAPVQALVFAAWFSAAVSLDEVRASTEYGFPKETWVHTMKDGTEAALSKANFLRSTGLEVIQAFIMYMIPLCRSEVSRSHSVLVGAAVRMAEGMGLHRDGEAYGFSPLETHVRRLIWHQLCFLDIRTCEAQGPKPTIRREDYDTKLPLNCEEDEILPDTTSHPEPSKGWTSSLLPIIRFEINQMMRIIWADRRKLEVKKTTLAAVLTKIEAFRKSIFEKYDRCLDERVPIQKYTKMVMNLLVYRLHCMVLHPYHSNTANPMPEKLSAVLINSGVRILEIAIQLESNSMFRQWAWYGGALQQYQIALLLGTEMFYRPQNKDAHRIWPCLDYVFCLDPNMPRDQKAVSILQEIAHKSSVYMNMRKVRAPTSMARAVPDRLAVKESPPPPAGQKPLPTVLPKQEEQNQPRHYQNQQEHQQHQQQQQQQQARQFQNPYQHQKQPQQHVGSQQLGQGGVITFKEEPGLQPPALSMAMGGLGVMQPHSYPQAPLHSQPPHTLGHSRDHGHHAVSEVMTGAMMQQLPASAGLGVGSPVDYQQSAIMSNMMVPTSGCWGLPHINPESPESNSDGGNMTPQQLQMIQESGSLAAPPVVMPAGGPGGNNLLEGINWMTPNEIDTLFPPEWGMNSGNWN